MHGAVAFEWTGEFMRPLRPKAADAEYVVGERYWLIPAYDTSTKSFAHEFAWLKEAHKNLPERLALEFPTPEHLRKALLIENGFYNQTIYDARTEEAAASLAAVIRDLDGFAVIGVYGHTVIVRRAKSQARNSMRADEFQRSKQAIMESVAAMIGVTVAQLEKNAGASA